MNRWLSIGAALLSFALVATSCDQTSDSHDGPTKDRNTTNFRVDGDGVSYLYRHPTRGLHQAASLEEIPLEHRSATIVVAPNHEEPSFEDERYPVADLIDAAPGDRQSAIWLSKKQFVRQNLASTYGHERANEVAFWAQEVTQLSPNSERARSSDRALRLLEEMPRPAEDDSSPNREESP